MAPEIFITAVALVLNLEGGFVDNPHDPGGRTNFGITQNLCDQYIQCDVASITREQAVAIYQKEFWEKGKFDLIGSQKVAVVLFAHAVNVGNYAAIITLQRALGPGLMQDGKLGPETLRALDLKTSIPLDETEFLLKLLKEIQGHYLSIVKIRKESLEFLPAWIHRTDKYIDFLVENI